MKRILTFSFFILSGSLLFAQSRQISGSKPVTQAALPAHSDFRSEIDTLGSFYLDEDCASSLIIYTSASGYVIGNNDYGDKEKVQLIFLPGTGTGICTDVLVYFGDMVVGAGNGTVRAVTYTVDGDGAPDASLGVSAPVSILDCDTSGFFTAFPIISPESFEEALFAGIDFNALYDTNDSIGIISTEDGCGDGATELYEKWSDNSWNPFDDGTTSSWQLNIAALIYAVVDFTPEEPPLAVDNFMTQANLTLYPAFPNPASSYVQLNYALAVSEAVTIEVFDAAGHRVMTFDEGMMPVGKFDKTLDITGLSSGKYYYSITHGGQKMFSKFSVVK